MPMELGLAGKAAIVTGGSDGLGRAVAERLSAEGVGVTICARREGTCATRRPRSRPAMGHPCCPWRSTSAPPSRRRG